MLDGNGKADTLISAAAAVADDSGVDADEFAAGVHQRAAGISGIDGGIGLNEVLVVVRALDVESPAAGGADDAHRDCLADPEWITNCEHDVTDTQLGGIPEGYSSQAPSRVSSARRYRCADPHRRL